MEELNIMPSMIEVCGFVFEAVDQGGCVSQCLVLLEGEASPDNVDELAEQARVMREQGVMSDKVSEIEDDFIEVEEEN